MMARLQHPPWVFVWASAYTSYSQKRINTCRTFVHFITTFSAASTFHNLQSHAHADQYHVWEEPTLCRRHRYGNLHYALRFGVPRSPWYSSGHLPHCRYNPLWKFRMSVLHMLRSRMLKFLVMVITLRLTLIHTSDCHLPSWSWCPCMSIGPLPVCWDLSSDFEGWGTHVRSERLVFEITVVDMVLK